MGHRHLFGMPPIFENDHDQNWNMHAEQPHGHIARRTAGENGCFFYPVEDVSPEGLQFASQRNSDTRSNGYISMGHVDQLRPCQPDTHCPPQDPYLPQTNAGAFGSVAENYFPHAASSAFEGQTPHTVEGCGFMDITMESGRVHQKRKNSVTPAVCEKGSSSRYNCGGTSSDAPAFSESRQDMLNVDSQHVAWDHFAANHSGHRDNSLSIRGEGSLRNVRSRPGIDLETNSLGSHLSDNPPLGSFTMSQHIEHSSFVDIPGPSSNALMTEWNPAHGRILLPEPCGYGHESTQFLWGSSPAALSDARGYDSTTSRNPVVPQLYHGSSNQSVRGPCTNHSHRSTLAFRPSNSMRLGNTSPSEEGLQSVVDTYSRHPRPLSTTGWHNSDRNRRSRITNERHRSFPVEAGVHGQMGHEGLMDRSALHSSRSTFDQHRDLRLDIDNMSYEELLALGERIGTVSTGLSEDSISKCLKETAYCPSDQIQNEENCVICLEAYTEADNMGTLNTCSHHYHVCCIKKWLLMKNSCPICKASALADDLREK